MKKFFLSTLAAVLMTGAANAGEPSMAYSMGMISAGIVKCSDIANLIESNEKLSLGTKVMVVKHLSDPDFEEGYSSFIALESIAHDEVCSISYRSFVEGVMRNL